MARTGLLDALPLGRLVARMPVWVRIALSTVSVVLGSVIVLRPTTALDVLALLLGGGMVLTGILEASGRTEEGENRWRGWIAVGWIVLGVFVLGWPGLTVRGVAAIVGILLLVNGAAGLGTAIFRDRGWNDRVADAAFGITGLIFGVLALAWPDITLLVVAVVFGASLIMRGVADLAAAVRMLRARRGAPDTAAPPRSRRPWGRAVVAVLSVVAAVAAALLTVPLRDGSAVVDPFYAAPRSLPHEAGRLVRAEPFTHEVPKGAEGWRILYTTTGVDGRIRVASGLVVVPKGGDPDDRWPVIDWNHSTTGYARHCAPSLYPRPFWAGGMFVIKKVLAQGWAVVATDYIGLGTEGPHPYLFGEASAHASLDAVRAAHEIREARLSVETVVWGHSQGGAAALWTGALARDYAPHLLVRGVAAFAPASDPPALVERVSDVQGGLIFASYAFAAFSDIYPDITEEDYIRPGLQPVMRAMSQRCLTDPSMALSVLAVLGTSADRQVFEDDPSSGPLGERLRENVAPVWIGPPLFLGQGGADAIVAPATQDAYAARVCESGQRLDYRRYAGYQHAEVMETYSPMVADAIEWTHARFDGAVIDAADPPCDITDVPR
ncbi:MULTISPECIES: lipase family protein [unclassified Microbacterium]|uniref:lipase family protein n=1 Tax=unclassified Microbacterium TaxID=2609290 RepID=UPI00301AA505